MEEVDYCDSLVVEVIPEGISNQRVVDVKVLNSENVNSNSFHEEDLLLFWVRAVQRRVHPESVEAIEVLEADGEDDALERFCFGSGGLGSSLCELECNSITRRS